ncbi:MAG: hypothetical protein KDB51_14110, partial [Propionibacteriaceae bacterium]|nr:hypothetical protein [Propionibacteriaceae bacterium]
YVKVRFGQERKHREEDGSFTDLGKTYDTFVAYDDNVQRIMDNYVPGDRFIAQGYVRKFPKADTGMEGEVFVVTGIGHDTAYTRYDVDRSARRTGPEQTAPEHTTPARTAERDAAAFNPPDRRPASTAPAISM